MSWKIKVGNRVYGMRGLEKPRMKARNLKGSVSPLSLLLAMALLTVCFLSIFSPVTRAVGPGGFSSPVLNDSGIYAGAVPPPYYEVIASVTWIYDGDTIQVWIDDIVVELDPNGEVSEDSSECVRFGGGIQAPETYDVGGPESTAFIESLIPVGTTVYLDLDNYARGGAGNPEYQGCPYRGYYGRLIAVIYAVIDGQWVNINAELLRWGMEAFPYPEVAREPWDKYTYIYSEFSMYDWPPYDNDYPYVLGSNAPPTSSVDVITPYWQTSVPFTITATASDPDGTVENVTLWYKYSSNGSSWGGWTLYGTDSSSPWEWESFNAPGDDGYYEFYSIAVDNDGNEELSSFTADAECGVDRVYPASSVNAISPYWQTSPFSVTATASDATSGVENVSLYYRYSSDNSGWGDWTLCGTDTAAPWAWSFTASSGDGYYEFYSIAGDNAGNAESAPAEVDARCGVGNVALGTPVKISPANGAKTNDSTPTFEWTPGENADNHRLLVDNDADFSSPEENVLLGATENTCSLSTPLADDNYSWKVIAINVTGESQSTVWTFLVDTVPPGVPAKSAPADGTLTTDDTPTLSWTAATDDSSGIAVYEIWIDNDSDFSSPEVLDNTVGNTATSYTPPGLEDDTYSWRVRAWDRAGNGSDFGTPWTFSVANNTRGVEVSISPENKTGSPGKTLTFTVTVRNTGEMADN